MNQQFNSAFPCLLAALHIDCRELVVVPLLCGDYISRGLYSVGIVVGSDRVGRTRFCCMHEWMARH